LNKAKNLLRYLKDWKITAPILLVFVASVFNLQLSVYLEKPWGIFSTADAALSKTSLNASENISDSSGAINSSGSIDGIDLYSLPDQINFVIVDSSYLLNKDNPLSNVLPTRGGLLIYKIQKGDSLAKIAASFGISLNTILWANPSINSDSLNVGKEIVILPVSGVLYNVQAGDTLNSIAQKYSIDAQKIIAYNPGLSPAKLGSIQTIIIPNGKPIKNSYNLSGALPNYPGYFAIPTTGWNWGILHNYNAVDIANACGTPVYASAEGMVVEQTSSGWNGGYGNYVLIEHPNNTKTRYAHLSKSVVSIGDYVSQGDLIGYIGNTGETHGPTGCHLHFEVYGARNPFAK
jgi:LysM repeat protein